MNKNSAQAYTKLKQRLKKFLTETGDHENLYVKQVEEYRKKPIEEESKSEESD